VVIDPHYEIRHSRVMNDSLILKLVKKLDGRFELPESQSGAYSYFTTLVADGSKQYRLVWLLEKSAIYIGIVNAFRVQKRR
jgi:hypothetical protein